MARTLFKQVNYVVNGLLNSIDLGTIGLPDIQRPFVWKNAKVRDLFDSMYRGYPVGYLLFWQNAYADDSRAVGVDDKQKAPQLLIVDGQQRLTSLYAVVKGHPVLRADYKEERIEIAFDPLKGHFEVADAAIRRDRAYIPNVSILWDTQTDLFELVDSYLTALRAVRELTEDEEGVIKGAIMRLHGLPGSFPLTALELSPDIEEEQVAEVFVRINSKGTPLNQADFILTLMSVFWDDGRKELERFCAEARNPAKGKPSPFNHFIDPDPDQLLRVAVGLGFRRGRLKHVYSLLRGKDLETGQFSEERRDQQFAVLKRAQSETLDLQHWHDFFKAISLAGYRGGRQITSANTLLFSYIFYLLGKTEYGVAETELRRAIAQWFFMAALTGRYTGSPESTLEFDLARLRNVKDASGFLNALSEVSDSVLTPDFWEIALPNDLATSSPRSPSLFAYYASLVLLDAKALFSDKTVAELLDPTVHAKKSAIERHHLFPRAYLEAIGIKETRDINQIANYAPAEWHENVEIGSSSPAEYVPELRKRFSPKEIERMSYWHALPDGWEEMEYDPFLRARRELIARIMKEGYERLRSLPTTARETPSSIEDLIDVGETPLVEFKSTLRMNLHTGEPDSRMELACLKTIAGFLNGRGGTLIIGVADDGTPVGLDADGFKNEDKMLQHFAHLVSSRLGSAHTTYIHPTFEDFDDSRALRVECWRAKSPVFVKEGNAEKFYVRIGTVTKELPGGDALKYIEERFKA